MTAPNDGWERLDARMLLIHPFATAVKLLPALIGVVILGSRSTGPVPMLLLVVAVVLIGGALRWLTTRYRVGQDNIELKTGLVQRKLLSIPRNRVRSVDIEAGPLHRLLGLAVLKIGTGQTETATSSSKFELNALRASTVPALRTALLAHTEHAPALESGPPREGARAAGTGTEIGGWSASWVRYAPLSASGLIAIAAVFAFLMQFGAVTERLFSSDVLADEAGSLTIATGALIVTGIAAALLVASSVLAVAQYLIVYGAFTLVDSGRVLHVSHGLLTKRQRALDRARLRGTTLHQPLALRLAGGAKLSAIMTGSKVGDATSSLLLPQAPLRQAHQVMGAVLHDRTLVTVPLRRHPRAALRRRFVRALWPVAALAATLSILTLRGTTVPTWSWLLLAPLAVAGAALAVDRYRGLGHATTHGWLITSQGSLLRRRDTLATDGVIGWTVRQTFFQRRAGLATLIAATPAGNGAYQVVDLAADDAWALAQAVTSRFGNTWVRAAC